MLSDAVSRVREPSSVAAQDAGAASTLSDRLTPARTRSRCRGIVIGAVAQLSTGTGGSGCAFARSGLGSLIQGHTVRPACPSREGMLAMSRGFARASGLLVVVAAMAACSSSPDWRGGGMELDRLGESLTGFDQAWRSEVLSGEVKANLPDSARCYFQVVQESEVTDTLLCGPVRFIGSKETTWQQSKIRFYPAESGKAMATLALDKFGEPDFDDGVANPNANTMRPDGAEADLGARLDEPAAPAAQVGQVVPLGEADYELASALVIVPTGRAEFQVGVSGDRMGDATERFAPPAGGSFVLIERGTLTNRALKAKLTISAGGKTIPVEIAEHGLFAVGIPGDGNDARVGVEFDGLTQWVSARTAARGGATAAGYYDGLDDSLNAECPEVDPGRVETGWRREFGCRLRLAREPYLDPPREPGSRRTSGWAKDGMVYLGLELEPRYDTQWYPPGTSFRSSSYDSRTQLRDTTIRVGGKEYRPIETIVTEDVGWGSTDSTTLYFEIPAGQSEVVVRGKVIAKDVLDYDAAEGGSPKEGSATFPVDVALKFNPSS